MANDDESHNSKADRPAGQAAGDARSRVVMEPVERKDGKLNALPVVIVDGKRVVKIVELDDPRQQFIEVFNERRAREGLTAKVA